MGKALMVLVAGFIVASALYNSDRSEALQDSTIQVSDHQYSVLAREAALKGYEMARQRLATTYTSGQVQGTYQGGTYVSDITVSGTVASVTSTGTMPGAKGVDVDYVVKAQYEVASSALPENAPPFMDYALLAEDDLNLNGNILTEVLVTGEAAAELNANMHTNGDLDIKGNSVSVQGFGTYVGYGSASPSKALQGSFSPNYNPTAANAAHQSERVELPVFNMADYLAKVTPDAYNVGKVLSGTQTLGTRDNPYIWHIDGNLTTLGNTTINGYVVFLVDGSINLTGNIVVGDSGNDGADESSVAFYASGDVTLGGNVSIYGQIYANGDLKLHGTPRIYGSLATARTATLSGTPKIYYRKASPALTSIWQDREDTNKLVAYSEW